MSEGKSNRRNMFLYGFLLALSNETVKLVDELSQQYGSMKVSGNLAISVGNKLKQAKIMLKEVNNILASNCSSYFEDPKALKRKAQLQDFGKDKKKVLN